MTLVIGGNIDGTGYLVADTLVTEGIPTLKVASTFDWGKHVLKVHILSSNIVVAFAGQVQGAMKIISALKNEIKENSKINPDQKLFEIYSDAIKNGSSFDCEFLSLWKSEEKIFLSKIAWDRIYQLESAEIGDEFDKFKQFSEGKTWYSPPEYDARYRWRSRSNTSWDEN